MSRVALVVPALLAGLACGASVKPPAPPTATLAGPIRLGDTASYPVTILGKGATSDRVSMIFGQAAYLTAVTISADRIVPLLPAMGHQSEIVDAGAQTISLDGGTPGPGNGAVPGAAAPTDNRGSAAAQMEYDRCLAAARNANAVRAARNRKQVGTDSKGNPIYEDVHVEYTDPRLDYESRCRMPAVNGAERDAPRSRVAQYLIVFASDAPVSNRDIVDLTITAGDARSTALAIGNKLFSARGAKWSASLVPW